MTPKYKAEELFNQYANVIYQRALTETQFEICKQCALIAVDEILESLGYKSLSDSPYTTLEARQYYVAVKQEIENL